MRTVLAAIALMVVSLFGASTATAQERDLQFYVGPQYIRTNIDTNTSGFRFDRSTDSVGVNGSVTGFVAESVGLTGELAANFTNNGQDATLVTALGGLTLQARNDKYQPFVRGLAGVSRLRAGNQFTNFTNTSDVSLAFAVGAGLDVKVSKNVAIRVIQADYLQTRAFGDPQHNLRLGAGIRF